MATSWIQVHAGSRTVPSLRVARPLGVGCGVNQAVGGCWGLAPLLAVLSLMTGVLAEFRCLRCGSASLAVPSNSGFLLTEATLGREPERTFAYTCGPLLSTLAA